MITSKSWWKNVPARTTMETRLLFLFSVPLSANRFSPWPSPSVVMHLLKTGKLRATYHIWALTDHCAIRKPDFGQHVR
jgi:hypothetical protein